MTFIYFVYFQEALRRVNEQLEATRQAEKLQSQVSLCLERLHAIADDGERTLVDSDAAPLNYRELADLCEKELIDARNLQQQLTPDLVIHLQSAIDRVTSISHRLADRWSLWQQFVVARDNANMELDSLRKPLNAIEQKPLRPLTDAIADLDTLKVIF